MTSNDRPTFEHSPNLPVGDFRFIALDVETACSDAGSICQIGLACVRPDNQIQTFSMFVDPRSRFDPFNTGLHGIGPKHVEGASDFRAAITIILPLLSRHSLVQHSSFDKRAVNAACLSCGMDPPELSWSDSVTIARRAWPEFKGNGGHGLGHLKKALKLQFHHHDAGEDARAAAMVVLHAEERLAMPFEELILPMAKKSTRRFKTKVTRAAQAEGPLTGSVAVFTGNLRVSRDHAADLAAAAGMEVKAGITKKTTHLIVGDQNLSVLTGQKKSKMHRHAEEMQGVGHFIQIISESTFFEVLKNG